MAVVFWAQLQPLPFDLGYLFLVGGALVLALAAAYYVYVQRRLQPPREQEEQARRQQTALKKTAAAMESPASSTPPAAAEPAPRAQMPTASHEVTASPPPLTPAQQLLQEREKARFTPAEEAQIERLVAYLQDKKDLYPRDNIREVILKERYSERVADEVLRRLYAS